MTARTSNGVLAQAQRTVQSSRSSLRAVHRAFGWFSEVGTELFLDAGQFGWTALLQEHHPAIRAEAERFLLVREALPNSQDVAPHQIPLSSDDQWTTSGSSATTSGTTPTACAAR